MYRRMYRRGRGREINLFRSFGINRVRCWSSDLGEQEALSFAGLGPQKKSKNLCIYLSSYHSILDPPVRRRSSGTIFQNDNKRSFRRIAAAAIAKSIIYLVIRDNDGRSWSSDLGEQIRCHSRFAPQKGLRSYLIYRM